MLARNAIKSWTVMLSVGAGACAGNPGSPGPVPVDPAASTSATSVADESLRCDGRSPTLCPVFDWQVVVNNGVTVPGDSRKFNSYNQPSVNVGKLVVFRARSKGGAGGEPAHGVFTRDMAALTPVTTVFDRNTLVSQPNNLGTMFVEPPSFPRIDMWSSTLASRGNHPPVWEYLLSDETETRAGTTGVYTNPFGSLITGASNLGAVPGFGFFAAPEMGGKFDVFPGAPAVTDGATLVFKGNFTVGDTSKTGVYYRDLTNAAIPLDGGTPLSPAGGTGPVVLIADSDTLIPGTDTLFGSTAPPSAVARQAVFAGFDNEDAPTLGGIYLAPLTGPSPSLTALVKIGGKVPGENSAVFSKLGEGVSFDGRFVAFWGAWGSETKTLVLQCPDEGNKPRLAYCREQYPNGFTTTVPLHQGIFVHDIWTRQTRVIAKAPHDYDDFVYWNFSGKVPGTGGSEEEGEPARWRFASFVAVSGLVDGQLSDAAFHTAFKARTGSVVDGAYANPVDGIYLRKGPGSSPFAKVVESGMDGTVIDPGAVYLDEETGLPVELPVTEMGIERDGFRGNSLTVNVTMGTEEAGWAGIYLTTVPEEEQ
ncbi:MAG TPA: hypothetical protein VLM85_02255 [Polyangiaceae bacterium]|nr:hypothetical protein [Polyangiaceae bacterium]